MSKIQEGPVWFGSLMTRSGDRRKSRQREPYRRIPLEDLLWSASVKGNFHDGSGLHTTTPLSIIPFLFDDSGTLVGSFLDSRGTRYVAQVGFRQGTDGPSDRFYAFDDRLELISSKTPKDGVSYLPLAMTPVGISYTASEVSRSAPLYGIRGPYQELPLLFIFPKKDGGHELRVLCKDAVARTPLVLIPNMTVAPEPVKGFMHQLANGTFRRQRYAVDLQRFESRPSATEQKKQPVKEEIDWKDPRSIVAHLDKYVIAQDRMKRSIAVAFSNYLHGFTQPCLIIGPSGVGKTYGAEVLAEAANLPVVITQASGKSEVGYVGDSISDAIVTLAKLADSKEPKGIVVFDEFDKLGASGLNSSFKPGIQDELIGLYDGGTVKGINTKNILFIAAGAFQGGKGDRSLADIVRERLSPRKPIGFGQDAGAGALSDEDALALLQESDLVTYGIKMELVGRLAVRTIAHPLTIDHKISILNDAKRSVLEKYRTVFQNRGYALETTQDALRTIAQAAPPEINARGLRAACASVFDPILYDPEQYADANKRIRIDEQFARAVFPGLPAAANG